MTKKEIMVCELPCPYCEKHLIVIKETEVFSPAVPADKKETFRAGKISNMQSQLEVEEKDEDSEGV